MGIYGDYMLLHNLRSMAREFLMKRHGYIEKDGKEIGEICSRCQKEEHYEKDWEGTSKMRIFFHPDHPNPPAITIDGKTLFMCFECLRELESQFYAAISEVALRNI